MARWDPGAEARLRVAALDLFVERGFDDVTAGDIAARAGLTRRTFFRYFPDKREVLFAGSEELAPAMAEAVLAADASLPPIDAVIDALAATGERLTELVRPSLERRSVIAASPELQERERTKNAALADAVAGALVARQVAEATAVLLGTVGVATFTLAYGQWVDAEGRDGFTGLLHRAFADLRSTLAGAGANVPP